MEVRSPIPCPLVPETALSHTSVSKKASKSSPFTSSADRRLDRLSSDNDVSELWRDETHGGSAHVPHGSSHYGVLSLSRTRPPIAVSAAFFALIEQMHLPNKTN